ncbi:hypothetical protein BC477_04090 [Clavibacter michiganensis subsp. michiganensis]|uniref:Uncharacterized protein n=1 Tax=Clavibacter michiganensis subsp. michiganensis TaxID=33013 RepID=A0A251XK67_CLAMM|nr:hypothetical protein BC477_04090 [Clavibacter michiganensis subsp. michiganensis]OUE03892.1 hypothetical protein CMMCAS07_03025 [Clavibacter michiganensis subsp. michiganensis]
MRSDSEDVCCRLMSFRSSSVLPTFWRYSRRSDAPSTGAASRTSAFSPAFTVISAPSASVAVTLPEWPGWPVSPSLSSSPAASPAVVSGIRPVVPASTDTSAFPLLPVPSTDAGATIAVGRTAMGLRTVPADPVQVSEPVDQTSDGAPRFAVMRTWKDFVWPGP